MLTNRNDLSLKEWMGTFLSLIFAITTDNPYIRIIVYKVNLGVKTDVQYALQTPSIDVLFFKSNAIGPFVAFQGGHSSKHSTEDGDAAQLWNFKVLYTIFRMHEKFVGIWTVIRIPQLHP